MTTRGLAIFDLDGTITRADTLYPYIRGYLLRHPWRLWRLPLCLGPFLRFLFDGGDRGALKSGVIRLTLGGLSRSQLQRWSASFVRRQLRGGVFAEALERIAAHRNQGAHLVLLSASPDLYVPEFARALGFDQCICTELRWHGNERLDGALLTANRRGEEKARVVARLLAEQQPFRSHAYGNSQVDLAHMRLVTEAAYVNGPARDLAGLTHIRAVTWQQPGMAQPAAGAPR
jgi:phosphatidylglycerophosphatase C